MEPKSLKRLVKSVEILTVQAGEGYVDVGEKMAAAGMAEPRMLVRIEGESLLNFEFSTY